MFTPIVFFISFLIRLFFVPLPGFKADIAYWKWWGMSAAHDGITGPLVNTAYNYPSFYLYILKFTSHVYEFFTGFNFKLSPNDPTFWSDSNFLYLLLIKLPYILADLGIGILIYKIVTSVILRSETTKDLSRMRDLKQVQRSFSASGRFRMTIPLLAVSLFLFNPVVIYNSSIWGQTDSLGAFLILESFYFLLQSRFSLMAVFSAVALFMKVQTVIFLPLLFLVVFLRSSLKETIKSLWVFAAAAIIINLPFFLTRTMARVLEIMYSSQTYFPFVSMNAYNLWWLIFGRASSSFWDQNLIAGLVSFKMMGIVLFGAIYSIALWLIIKSYISNKLAGSSDNFFSFAFASEKKLNNSKENNSREYSGTKKIDGRPQQVILCLVSAFVLVSFAFFLFLTQMHERYLFPLFVFFPILLGLTLSSRRKFLILTAIYLILSTTTLLNLHQVMIMNYPDNTLPLLPNAFSEPLTKVIAFINIIIFIILFVFFIFRQNDLKILLFIIPAALLFLLFISLPKLWLYSRPVIYLSDLSPKVVSQGYGTLQKDKSVAGAWLSSLYYFFDKGLGTHAVSQIVYDIGSRYQTFSTNFGIDTEANETASVVFIIKGDGKTLFTSPKMTRFSFPGFAKINVSGVKNLELDVTDAGDGINSDHADWLAPRLYK